MTGAGEGEIGGQVRGESDGPGRVLVRQVEEIELAAAGDVPEENGGCAVVRQLERLQFRVVAGGDDVDRTGLAGRIDLDAGEDGEVPVLVRLEVDGRAVGREPTVVELA